MADIKSATVDPGTWITQEHYVERQMDNSAITSAHPDDTLLLAGPPRFSTDPEFINRLVPIGHAANIGVSESSPVQMVPTIGSGRHFPMRSKNPVSLNIGRFWVRGRSLLRVLYTHYVQARLNVARLDDAAAYEAYTEADYGNLQSELFYMPFGLALMVRDKSRGHIAAYYFELCMIQGRQFSIGAGSPSIMDSVSIVADRMRMMPTDSIRPHSTHTDAPSDLTIQSSILGSVVSSDESYIPSLSTR